MGLEGDTSVVGATGVYAHHTEPVGCQHVCPHVAETLWRIQQNEGKYVTKYTPTQKTVDEPPSLPGVLLINK